MILYRCSLKKWSTDLTGEGAFRYGGRWNTPGHRMIYTAENNLLAALEVSLRIPLTKISKDYIMMSVQTPDKVKMFEPMLKKNWHRNSPLTQKIGDTFLTENKFLLMKVPSALMSNTFNYLINPLHDHFNEVKIGKPHSILFDERLISLMSQNE